MSGCEDAKVIRYYLHMLLWYTILIRVSLKKNILFMPRLLEENNLQKTKKNGLRK